MGNVFGTGHPVVGQFHDEGDGLAFKHGVFREERHQNTHQDAQEVQSDHDEPSPPWKEHGGKEPINGKLGGTTHEGRQQDGHLPVPLGRKGAAGHDARDSTAKANKHGHNAPPG